MSYKRISQREARQLKKRVRQLEDLQERQFAVWRRDYPGTDLGGALAIHDTWWFIIKTARKLGHAVVVLEQEDKSIKFFAVPKPVAH